MICNKCNTENIQGASFCKECGNPLSATVKLTKEDSVDSMENPFENASSNEAATFTAVASSAQTENPYQKPQYTQAPPMYNQSQYTQPYQQQVPNYPPLPPQDESHMTTLDWILRYCIALIPLVGPIIYIVMIFVWAFGDTPKKSLKTWAQAQLILSGIGIALMIVIMIFGGITTADLLNEMPY